MQELPKMEQPDFLRDESLIDMSLLVRSQELVWLAQQRHPEVPLYEVPFLFEIHGELDIKRFESAFQSVVDRTLALQMTASDTSWSACARSASTTANLDICDVSERADSLQAAQSIVRRELGQAFSPTKALHRAVLMRVAPEQWQLLVKVHHAFSDAVSGKVLWQRLGAAYTDPNSIEFDGGAFHRHAGTESVASSTQSDASSQAWWAERCSPCQPTLFFQGRAVTGGLRQQRQSHRDSVTTALIEQLSGQPPFRQITAPLSHFNILATALNAWLYRLQSTSSICIGATTHGRTSPADKNAVGLYMSLMPFLVHLDPNQETFASLSRSVAVETRGLLSHSRSECMSIDSQSAFDVALNLIDLNVDDWGPFRSRMQWLHNGHGDPHQKLTISAHRDLQSGWQLDFDFNTDCFTAEQRERSIQQFVQTLSAMNQNSDQTLADYDLLTSPELQLLGRLQTGGDHHVAQGANSPTNNFVADPSSAESIETATKTVSIWGQFERIVLQDTDAIAIDGLSHQWTYGELHQRAIHLSTSIDNACGPLVPVLCRRDEQAVVAMLSVLASGRCFLPIDCELPNARIELLFQAAASETFLDASAEQIRIANHLITSRVVPCPLTSNACYVMFTSGSTGVPNGVVVGHEALSNLLGAFENLATLSKPSICSWWTNVGFDVAIYEVFSALLYGHSLKIPSSSCRLDADAMLQWLSRQQISSAYLPPFFLSALNHTLTAGKTYSLQRLLVGVEPISQSLLASIQRKLPGTVVINGYGPTEATVCATLEVIDPACENDQPASIGYPIPGNRVRVVDPNGTPVPVGVRGELWIGGIGLADGYLANPTLTQSKFLDSLTQQRWYRTGDQVRLLENGKLEFLGRKDDQLKIAGLRFERGELIAIVQTLPWIVQAEVLTIRQDDGREQVGVVAIPTVESRATWTGSMSREECILDHCRQHLPAALVPEQIHLLDRFPRTINGKMDHQAMIHLLKQARRSSALEANRVTDATNPLEYTLASLWSEVLRKPVVSVTDHFFELGGTSLDAMNIVSRARQLGVAITIHDLFSRPTVRGLADRLGDGSSAKAPATAPSSRETIDAAQVTRSQLGMWYAHQSDANDFTNHFQVRWECTGKLDPVRVKACFEKLVRRHNLLRTVFADREGQMTPITHETFECRLEFTDRILDQDQLLAIGRRPFHLDAQPAYRILHSHPQQDQVPDQLVITVHHVAFDQPSLQILMADFASTYSAMATESIALTDTFPSPLRLDRDDFQGEASANNTASTGELVHFSLSKDLSEQLRRVAAQQGASIGVLLLTAFAILRSRYTYQHAFEVGIPYSTRDHSTAQPMLGHQLDVASIHCDISNEDTVAAVVNRMQVRFQSLITDTSQRRLASESGMEGLSQMKFETMFVIQAPWPSVSCGPELHLSPTITDLGASKFELTWFVSDHSSHIEYAIEYRTASWQRTAIQRMAEQWTHLLSAMVEDADQAIGQLNAITDDDRRAASELNANAQLRSETDLPACITHRIDSTVKSHPQNDALVCGDQRWSYGTLGQVVGSIANQLASLESASVEPTSLECSPATPQVVDGRRDAATVAEILAILKSGRCYTALDWQQPAQRLQAMLNNLGSHQIVSPTPLPWLHQRADIPNAGVQALADSALENPTPGCLKARHQPMDQPAYLMHTSGSSGIPKAVAVSRSALVQSTHARTQYYARSPERFLMVSPFWFDSSVAGIFWTLSTGGCLILPTEDQLHDLHRLMNLIAQEHVTDTLMLPSLWQVILQHADVTQLQTIQRVIVAGEACPASLVDLHHDRLPGVELHNEYGPTEASVWATACELHPGDRHPVSMGRATPGCRLMLRSADGAPTPVGGIGEIIIAGSRLADGYHASPALSQERFPIDPATGERIYRTGDLGRLAIDGSLSFLGRIDDQLKINGQRTEPAEIEFAMQSIPGVQEAAVAMVQATSRSAETHPVALANLLAQLEDEHVDQLLHEARSLGQKSSESFEQATQKFRIKLNFQSENLVAAPRQRQRKWMVDRLMTDTLADLHAIDEQASQMVPGSDQPHLPRDLSIDKLSDQEIMEDWQTPLMQRMAEWSTESHGDVLEIGFGRGVAAEMIQACGVNTHTIIEMNPHSINAHFHPWRERHADRDIRLVAGRWQDTLDQLSKYDAVFFHAFPMNEQEFVDYVAESATFAEHFFPIAAELCRPGGSFTYLTTEVDSLSRRHQRSLLQHFRELKMMVQPLNVPNNTKDAWWTQSMVVLRATK